MHAFRRLLLGLLVLAILASPQRAQAQAPAENIGLVEADLGVDRHAAV